MELRDLARSAVDSLTSQWLRTALTLLGVSVGIGAVVAVMVLGEGSKRLVAQEIRDIGQNLFVVGIAEGDSVALAKEGELSLADAEAVERGVPSVVAMIPHASQITSVKVRGGKRQVYVLGTTERLPELRDSIRLRQGRFLSRRDVRGARKVAVISWQLEKDLARGGSALGRRIFLGNTAVRVVGVTAKGRQSVLAGSGPPRIYLPITCFHRLFQTRRVEWLEARAADSTTLAETVKRTVRLIGRRHRGANEYAGESLEDTIQATNRAIDLLSLAIGLIAAISLFVAAVGVMNVMLVSVTERTREIGLRKAVGATSRAILGQFLTEAVALCLSGGSLGAMLGGLAAILISRLLSLPFAFPWGALGAAFGVSLAVGLFSGTYPAARAAALDPIEALRQE